MSVRIAITTALAFVGAAAAISACEPAPQVCTPKLAGMGEGPPPDPACTACVEDKCTSGDSCADECKEYGACTCDCDEDDLACFEACANDRSESCASCQQEAGNALVGCIMSQCQVCAGGGGDSAAEDDGGSSWTAGDDGSGSSWTAGDDDGGGSEDGGGGASCEQLHAQCCPNLEGFDRELCDGATDEGSCALWLEIFAEEGKC